ncbi:MAG: SulP family inorganic anion transporter [Reichenbachiella sp.]|uniref:SulP family inorganic anion transporter n=1 Tax=Reichenbachiella sp. TaxID=2184521 RepID=UPI0032645D6F
MIKERFYESIKYIKRDALAGTVAGVMAVPLTVGICLMSEYPVMTGLYTVIFAGLVSFITYLFKPGNYTGMPGVAAGLAPALALGIHTFGIENMPFVIMLTAVFQAIVWKYRLERYILRIVPHYLVEGLLAGVGLKIAMKFVPFLYDIEHETEVWLNYEREVILALSLVSFVSFVLLYKYYKKKMPALPYFVIMATSFVLSFFMPLPRISIDAVPFELSLPLPHFGHLNLPAMLLLAAKMIGYAMMLGTIDVIEQVMSNVAIEKMDPMKRKADSNNSLLAIWIANLGATFFGGMTNLDGLAKSTTNTVAGAVTKLSNLFTALVILLVVLFPVVLEHMPEYALGIIMVYSGFKMIANIAHVRSEGRYALIMAGICGLLVFELGIFEGLLILLAVHAIIQFIFMKRMGKTNVEVVETFRDTFRLEGDRKSIEREDQIQEPSVPVLDKWVAAVNAHDPNGLARLYADEAIMIPAFSTRVRRSKDQIKDLYRDLFEKDGLEVVPYQVSTQKINGLKVDSGQYKMKWNAQGFEEGKNLRFSFVIQDGKVISHHSSMEPGEEVTISHPEAYDADFVE